MILPSGVNKATGLAAALAELGIDADRVVGVGDGENDHSLLGACGFGVAVANAVPALQKRADLVTRGARGQGIIELCDLLIEADKKNQPPSARAPAADPERLTPRGSLLGGGGGRAARGRLLLRRGRARSRGARRGARTRR